jgi:hypothetical protein
MRAITLPSGVRGPDLELNVGDDFLQLKLGDVQASVGEGFRSFPFPILATATAPTTIPNAVSTNQLPVWQSL